MELAEIKATRSPVEKAGTLCPDSTCCTSQYIHCTRDMAQASHHRSLASKTFTAKLQNTISKEFDLIM